MGRGENLNLHIVDKSHREREREGKLDSFLLIFFCEREKRVVGDWNEEKRKVLMASCVVQL